MTLKHLKSYWNKKKDQTYTHENRGSHGRATVGGGGVMEALGSVLEVEVMRYLRSPLANPAL